MKKIYCIILVSCLLFTLAFSTTVFATGDGNVDGGGGNMGGGSEGNVWNIGNEGVRVTLVRTSDHIAVTTPIDLTNKKPNNVKMSFGKIGKISYSRGQKLSPYTKPYAYVNPSKNLPQIISASGGNRNIAAIKNYFTDELVIKYIASVTGVNYDVLIGGQYKIMLEPIAYLKFQGIMIAMTATEAALYDEQTNGLLRKKMGSLTSQNLPLAMFLETADLGYSAWSGPTKGYRSNAEIKSSLGLGIVRFSDAQKPPKLDNYDYEYRVDTEVLTAVTVSGGQSDVENPTTVRFNIAGKAYTVSNVYYPKGDSQLVWVRWKTPKDEQDIVINVSASGPGLVEKATINCKIVDLDKNPPPNPVAGDRNDSFSRASVPNKAQKSSASWSVWRPWWQENWVWESRWNWMPVGCDNSCNDDCVGGHGSWIDNGKWVDNGLWEFSLDTYRASLSADMIIKNDSKNPTASDSTFKSGYGINQIVTTDIRTNQSSAVTDAQNAITYFPEFGYENYWRLLDCISGGYSARFEFNKNNYSTYKNRTHFTPIWMPDGNYTPYTWLIDCWTPQGMLSMNLTDSLNIQGDLWQDWHIAPLSP